MSYGTLTVGADVWKFPARLDRVVDGDTVDLTVDLGFSIQRTTRFRLFGVDTAEVYGVPQESDDYQRGAEHREFVVEWFDTHSEGEWPLVAWTAKETGKYGRYVTEIVADASRESLNQALIEKFDVADDTD